MTRGPDPKDPSVVARRNKSSTRAVLKAPVRPRVPPLPTMPRGHKWHAQVQAWWKRAWSSPMVGEWTESDVDNLYMAARLMQQFWAGSLITPGELKALAGEIRQIQSQCGLTPMSRRALQWEIEKPDSKSKTSARKSAPAKSAPQPVDPRARFKVVAGGKAAS